VSSTNGRHPDNLPTLRVGIHLRAGSSGRLLVRRRKLSPAIPAADARRIVQ
jgi:hypothetical protein